MIFAPKPLAIALADGLTKRGHTVYFFGSSDIGTKATLVGGKNILIDQEFVYHKLLHAEKTREKWGTFYLKKNLFDLDLTQKAYLYAKDGQVDIIHAYHDIFSHFFDGITDIPTVYTLHDPLPPEGTYEYWILNEYKNHNYIPISNAFRKGSLKLNFLDTVYHGIDVTNFPFSDTDNGYFLFMARLIPEKGLHTALKVVLRLNVSLKIASDFSSNENNKKDTYYNKKIKPYLGTSKVTETGMVLGEEKNNLLAGGRALLFPIEWEEPFGMVMIEAMACGTPVVAFARGSVPEVIKDGETGFIVNPSDEDKQGDWIFKRTGVDGFGEAVERIYSMPDTEYRKMRYACRRHVEENFTVEKMVNGYETVYRKILGVK
jgi:glycosyltransferase involved in cell wall biosynthesis